MPLRPTLLLTCLALAGCGGKTATLHLMDPPPASRHLADRLGRVEVQNVSLPHYANTPEITIQTAGGALRSLDNQLWADTPATAITRILADQISEQSGATAIAEPWPLSDGPDRRLSVRVSRLYAGADGKLHLSGRYFITPADPARRNIVRSFNISVPLARSDTSGVAQAQATALERLATRIAQLK